MQSTLAEALVGERVDFNVLQQRYQPVLSMVDVLIGVVPNCDPYLEIWPAGFRSYNLMVPNFLNLPAVLIGRGAPKAVVGLAMYASSRAASCAYCSAHTCSFALRRGSTDTAVTGENRTPAEQAATALAEALSTMPHGYSASHKATLLEHYSETNAEWIAMGVAMMGFLNKFMDAMGVELESDAVADVASLIEPTGWSVGHHGWAGIQTENAGNSGPPVDSLSTIFKVARNAPGAIRLERSWLKGIPAKPAESRQLLNEHYHWDEPILTDMRHAKPARALAAMLRDNLDPEQTEIGIGLKALSGLVFATHANNDYLIDKAKKLAVAHKVAPDAVTLTSGTDKSGNLDIRTKAVIDLSRAIAPSPAAVDTKTIIAVTEVLSATEVVEIAVWVSINQLLHRLSLWYRN